jgi:DNA-binding NarL/FixJ family response regulator
VADSNAFAAPGRPVRVAIRVSDPILSDWVANALVHAKDLSVGDGDDPADVTIVDHPATDPGHIVRLTDGSAAHALQHGAESLIPHRNLDPAVLANIVRVVAAGYTVASADEPPEEIVSWAGHHEDEPGLSPLTAREQAVLALLAEGASNKMIARQLAISPSTAKFHVASLLRKLSAHNRLDAVATGVRRGLVMI